MKKLIALSLLCLVAGNALGHDNSFAPINNLAVKGGMGLGSVIAIVTSWDRNKSVLWAIIHGLFSWLYVIYFVVTRD